MTLHNRLMPSKLAAVIAMTFGALALSACGNGDTETAQAGETASTSAADTDMAQDSADGTAETVTTDANSPGTQEMTLGDADAPVTLIEYASVTCPACAGFHQAAYPRLKEQYIDTGKVQLVFREFPTSPPQLSYLGSALARCAADRNGPQAYFAMLSTLFANQQQWVSQNFQQEILSYAAQAGIGEEAFRECVRREEIIGAINENVEQGRDVDDVTGTPTFILDGEKLEGYRTYDDIFAMIDEALVAAGAEPPADAGDLEATEMPDQTPGAPADAAEENGDDNE